MSDVCDGDYYRSHSIFKQSDKTLQIFAYYDELVLTNSLMSRRNKYKIGKLKAYTYSLTCMICIFQALSTSCWETLTHP